MFGKTEQNKIMKHIHNIVDTSKLFLTSDSHMGHFNICRLCGRPFGTREELNEGIISAWNKVVPEDGIVIHLGDLTLSHSEKDAIRDYRKLAEKLNGKIILVSGNHDFIPLMDEYHPIDNFTDKFQMIVDKLMLHINGKRYFLNHEPVSCYPADYMLHGHVHLGKFTDERIKKTDNGDVKKLSLCDLNTFDCGVDHAAELLGEYRPFTFDEVMYFINKQNEEGLNQVEYLLKQQAK